MTEKLEEIRKRAEIAIREAKTLQDLDDVEICYLGRKGELTGMLRQLSSLPDEEKKSLGSKANDIKGELERMLLAVRRQLLENRLTEIGRTERVDVTEPGRRPPEGHLHLVTQAIREVTEIFSRIGFVRTRYPEVDWDWYAFESLNMPKDHPARDEWETFFMDAPESKKGKMVLTPHTSNAQVRELERGQFPVRMINIAKCYRRQIDVTHVPMFHQFEGLYVDTHVSITHLRGVLDYFAKEFFGPDRAIRLRPFHFRFTEPSFEIDVSCAVCKGTGEGPDRQKCRVCKRGWLELGGAGMVHPNVLKAGNVDPKKYSGFAFGWGVERTALMKSGTKLDDIRVLYKNDLRFLKQF
ncbi:phenylalanine--tRNA ligase subunit alpha [Patescibacteria group bacterium]|uniref:Phenylalanine--tRNA ligase alpha subunit n=1 Tax=candidate division WWE3 bacterium TaxID=2053526 RepID=A0A928Y5Z2_UNCKA|nr:phenylalanine--tRNA ligase subunit alpha [candidate division WWE3 bacterium]MCL4733050.1 phenylalanine--tRNA ligase subunit alpha [Patescibacteria group bacterium]MDL1953341.1 phenylalanine--tRNA ligase subunit alpha [Candidatus Uhrbacteria bacterium UHB]RIL00570.1 MAG: phenylalanine--tRNA ligase subunit alpha [Candidatus Uhrbacteria bacterium]